MCMYVYIYIYIYICVCMYTCTCMYTYATHLKMCVPLTRSCATAPRLWRDHELAHNNNTLQHAATRCNTLQHVATHCSVVMRWHIIILDTFMSMCAALLWLCATAPRLWGDYEVTRLLFGMCFSVCVLHSWDCVLLLYSEQWLWGDTWFFLDAFLSMCAALLTVCATAPRLLGDHEATRHLFGCVFECVRCAPEIVCYSS